MVEELLALLIKRNFIMDDKNTHNAKNTLSEIYEKATEERFSFLFVKLTESDINEVLTKRYRLNLVDDIFKYCNIVNPKPMSKNTD